MPHKVVETFTIHKSQDLQSHPYINQYELISTLGEGMHGKVMLARDARLNERVAIKIMRRNDPHNRRLPKSHRLGAPPLTAQQETECKIRREIAVMKKCSHQNLVRLREVIDDPASKKVYLVMENLEGGEVKWRSKGFDEPVLELSQVQRIMRDVTLGLEYLHHQGIIHRDIKPANLLWTADRQSVKICDFGVSHFTVASQREPHLYDEAGLTKTAGSPAFFAPEICHIPNFTFDESQTAPAIRRGSQSSHSQTSPSSPSLPPITKQIDIWALGVTFYCLLFGTPPWQGQTEFAMFRAICTDDFYLPDTMARDRIPTGGRDRKPEGREVGWCVVGLLEGLLEKDQDKRITLADMKRIPWIQNGVREPDKWLRDTAPNTESRVVVTEEDTKFAIKRARFFHSGWMARITSTIKRVPLPLIPGSRGSSKVIAANETKQCESTGSTKRTVQTESLSRARSSRTRGVMDRQFQRFIGNSSPTRYNSVGSRDRRRNSSAGIIAPHTHSYSDPTSLIDTQLDAGPSSRRSIAAWASTSRADPWSARRQSDSLQLPRGNRRSFFHNGTGHSSGHSTCASPASSPTTPDEQPATGSKLKRLSQVMRSHSVKKAIKGARGTRESRTADGPSRGRTSAETLNIFHPVNNDLGLTHEMRASSWGSPSTEPDAPPDEYDGHTSLELTGSEAGGTSQDFNKSVVRFGAGGYVDGPTTFSASPSPPNIPGASGTTANAAGMTHSDSSSNSTATAGTPQPHQIDSVHHPPRVMSPLSRTFDSEEEVSSDVFEDTGTDELDDGDEQSSDDEVLELRTRRPSAVLSRSANASPLR